MSIRDRFDGEPARSDPATDANLETATGTGRGTDLGTLATALAALTVLGIAVATGVTVPTAGAVLAIALLVGSLSSLSADSLAARAIGSCLFVGGLALLGGSLAFGRPGTTIGAVAVGATAYALCVRGPHRAVVSRTARDSTVGAVVGGVLAAIGFGAVGTVLSGLRTLHVAATTSASTALFTVLGLSAGTLVLLELARPTLEPWLPDGVEIPSISDGVVRVIELPTGVHYLLAFLVVVLLAVDVSSAFESTLAALGPVGAGLEWVLRSGLVHLLVGSVALTAGGVLAGRALAPVGRTWLGSYPLRTLALASGGAVVAALVVALTQTSVVPTATGTGVLGFLGLLVVTFFVVNGLGFTAAATGRSISTLRRAVLAVGATALFATTVVAALDGLEALAVFAGVAATILVWDIGENALTADRQLGHEVDTREVELAHATGSVLVGCAGVALAAVAIYVLGNVSPPSERWQAVAPLALALAALVVLTLAVQRETSSLSAVRRTAARAIGRVDLRRLPNSYPLVFALLCLALLVLVLIALGFGHVVFFVAVVALPFFLMFALDLGGDSPYEGW